MIVTSCQDLELCGKQISQSFSDCELMNSPKNGTKVHCLYVGKICFPRNFKDVTIIPSLPFLVSRFCTPPEVKFAAFGLSKHREGKSLSKYLFCFIISIL